MAVSAVRVEQLQSIPLAVVRRQVQASQLAGVIPRYCGVVWDVVRAQQVKAGRHVAIYWDGSIRLEVGVELFGTLAEHPDVVRSATPAGPVATATYLGPYAGLGAAHAAVREWCRAHKRQPAGPNWEIYGHWQDEWDSDPSQIRTDVCYLLSGDNS
jgi:effector-binding domain-containing protein